MALKYINDGMDKTASCRGPLKRKSSATTCETVGASQIHIKTSIEFYERCKALVCGNANLPPHVGRYGQSLCTPSSFN